MATITISRQLGSLGTEIAQRVADQLDYSHIDKKRIEEALSNYGLFAPEVEKFDEKKPPFWDSFYFQRKKFLHSLEMVIYDFARKGNAVIVGRGGQALLRDIPGVLHVRIIAPFQERLRRVMAVEGDDEKKAIRILNQSDKDSAGFLRSFFDVDWDDRTLYDLMINTEKLSLETGVKLIVNAISSPEIKEGEKEAEVVLADRALAQKAEIVLMGILGTGIASVRVRVKAGTVIISGHVTSEMGKEDCERALVQLEGVTRVESHLYVQTFTQTYAA